MKIDFGPLRLDRADPKPLTPYFDATEAPQADAESGRRLWRPVAIGGAVVAAAVVALTAWSAVAKIDSAVVAPGQVRVEANRKTVRHRDGGVVRQILVREGQRVRLGQPLLVMDEVQARASVDVLQSQQDAVLAQLARYQAESAGRRQLAFAPALNQRASDPEVSALIRDQQLLFASRLSLFESQSSVLEQRIDQLQTQISGVQAQLNAVDEQIALTREELAGYQTLHEKGYAPKTLILRYERALADLGGRRGQFVAEINRLGQAIGEARLQLVTLRNERISQAAEGLRQMQTQLADVTPRLTAARQVLDRATVRSPADGYVLNLTQFTIGGVVAPGELLMDVVPADAPLIVSARVAPTNIDNVAVGQAARVRISAFGSRAEAMDAEVTAVSADALLDERTGNTYFVADVRIDPPELAKAPDDKRITPGMPAEVMIVTGERTILSYVMSPITDTLRDSLREE